MRQAWSVVDLGFGDAGKGATVDGLVRQHAVQIVIRHHGGAQAGHNVVLPDGRHHTFSQFGAGTFVPGCLTLLGPDFLFHPLGLEMEEQHLREVGVADGYERLVLHSGLRVITPYQQAVNHVRERRRGAAAHGTCGVGVGECVSDSLESPEDTVHAIDLDTPGVLRAKLVSQRDRKRSAAVEQDPQARALFDDPALIGRVIQAWSEVRSRLTLVTDSAFRQLVHQADKVVFEGAQGVLLDQWWGFHPHTTWSDCTGGGIGDLWDGPVHTLGVIRSYACRHGAGPLPTEGTLARPAQVHNTDDGWQGAFRVGALDAVLLRYALEVCPVDALVLRHLDVVSQGAVGVAYEGLASRFGTADRLRLGERTDLTYRAALARALLDVRVRTEKAEVAPWLVAHTGLPVQGHFGPTHQSAVRHYKRI